jgi:hypothetical protein
VNEERALSKLPISERNIFFISVKYLCTLQTTKHCGLPSFPSLFPSPPSTPTFRPCASLQWQPPHPVVVTNLFLSFCLFSFVASRLLLPLRLVVRYLHGAVCQKKKGNIGSTHMHKHTHMPTSTQLKKHKRSLFFSDVDEARGKGTLCVCVCV